MSEYNAMTVNERLYEAGLIKAFDKAAKKHNIKELNKILTQVELSEEDISKIIDWVENSPHSEFDRNPISWRDIPSTDKRLRKLDKTGLRIVKYLIDEKGGISSNKCLWEGCAEKAIIDLAYCPYCAYTKANIRSC